MKISLFYITTGSEEAGLALGKLAVESHLAACANVFPVQSVYPWEGDLLQEMEFVLVLKTLLALTDTLRRFIEQNHSYDIPCILSWDVEVNEAYGKWIEENISMT